MKKLISILSIFSIFSLLVLLIPTQADAASTGTGPYRKVLSNSGYSWMSTNVYIPGGNDVSYGNSTDTGYIYLGGHSGSVEVDAGLQHSPTLDNWAPFISVNGTRPSSGTSTTRFKSGQTVFMKFYVTSDNTVELSVSGIATDGVKRTVVVNATANGWKKSGTGNSLKRVTSIAQVGGDNFASKSYLKNVYWSDATIGTSSTSNAVWSGEHTNAFTSYQAPYVSVQYVNQSTETVNINLN
ncbi:YrpD family protein [Lysinibacillus parviboronicapiens]|uniref:Uncharacterized protein n=1 Tax=Lysinibacillus parviboronicapiens TaxID=436516 RepID=A0ABV2PGT5_9BACI|nr:YrpD family protein [Lysinibacillus parviboronicapiens]